MAFKTTPTAGPTLDGEQRSPAVRTRHVAEAKGPKRHSEPPVVARSQDTPCQRKTILLSATYEKATVTATITILRSSANAEVCPAGSATYPSGRITDIGPGFGVLGSQR